MLLSAATLLASLVFQASAQTTTDCQPLNTTDCPPDPALSMDYNFHFNATPADGSWETTVGKVDYTPEDGAAFVINKQGDSPTLRSKFYIFWGRVEIWMKVASGTGIISSVMLLSDDLDEIDWEFMGGNGTHASNNYFGKGVPDFHNAKYFPVPGGVLDDYHNYTTLWTKDSLQFFIDGQNVRTLLPEDANKTHFYPQTPMRVHLGIWAGGDPTLPEGTRQWAGGDTDYDKGPFTMHVRSARVADFSRGKEYSYGDQTGSWESIKIAEGNSTVHQAILAGPPETLADKWNKLSSPAKIGIYASAGAVIAAGLAALAVYCVRQRRRGAREATLAESRAADMQREVTAYKAVGLDPDSLAEQTEYNPGAMQQSGIMRSDGYSVPGAPPSPSSGKWGAPAAVVGVGGAGAVASSTPLLRNGDERSPPGSPDHYADSAYHRNMDASPPASRSGMPSVRSPPQLLLGGAIQSPSRAASTPNSRMRGGPPAMQTTFGGPLRTQSPAQVSSPPPRSFTADGSRPRGYDTQDWR